jgi:hypothetical protein
MIDPGARSFLEIFDAVHAPVLGGRRDTFRKVFEVLEARRRPFTTIVETGTAHISDGAGGPGDYALHGNSTLLFDDYQIGWLVPDPPPPPPARAPGGPVEAEFLRRLREPVRYRYVRVGFDERVVELLPGGGIGDGRDRCEEHWFVEDAAAGLELILAGVGQVTCRLTRGADGVWRGRWCSHERMMVELCPLS